MILRQCEIVTNLEHTSETFINVVLMGYSTIKEWAYILHDKDINEKGELKKPHFHIYLNFGVAQDTDKIAKWFEVKPNFINKIKGRKKDMLKYLIHKNAPEKYQYDLNQVKSNFDLEVELLDDDIIGDFKNYSYAQMLDFIDKIQKPALRVKHYERLKKLWLLETELIALKGDRKMKVWFVTGESQSGKTTWAKEYCKQHNKDFYVSSSDNDPLQDYKGQKVLILDDARDSTFSFNNLLKLLDNHTSSSVKSRYNNKVFNGDTIIITSVIPINKWYKNNIERPIEEERLKQLYRRITGYILFTKNDLKAWERLDHETGEPIGEPIKAENYIRLMYIDDDTEKERLVGSVITAMAMHPKAQQALARESLKLKLRKRNETLKQKVLNK
jgi:hypoxanthine phosphoribosyltransferase